MARRINLAILAMTLVIIITSLTAVFLSIIKSDGGMNSTTIITCVYKPETPKVLFGNKGKCNKYSLTLVTVVFIPNLSSCLHFVPEEIIP